MSSLRILLVAEHASAQFGGEAALPLHYYRVLRSRGAPRPHNNDGSLGDTGMG
jgi:hypothetical protein